MASATISLLGWLAGFLITFPPPLLLPAPILATELDWDAARKKSDRLKFIRQVLQQRKLKGQTALKPIRRTVWASYSLSVVLEKSEVPIFSPVPRSPQPQQFEF